MNLSGLLPLIPLTEHGKEPAHVQAMIDRLAQQQERDLLSISSIVGSLVFTKAGEREWFKMMRANCFCSLIKPESNSSV